MNEVAIQNRLWFDLQKSFHVAMPGYTPAGWWENDFYGVTKAGYWVEYEIKTSAADFRADSKKSQRRWSKDAGTTEVNKHDLLAARSPLGPSRFFFVIPEALESKVVIPEWAGLIVVTQKAGGRLFTKERKAAPKLHRNKVEASEFAKIKTTCYWRFWNLRTRMATEVERSVRRHLETCRSTGEPIV
jgi:hypothetical protein